MKTRRALLCLILLFALTASGCGEDVPDVPDNPAQACAGTGDPLAAAEVDGIVKAAAGAVNQPMTIAVVDRAGRVLGLFRKSGASPNDDDLAVSLARTGAFFSNNQAPLSSRTVRFISGIHFPPGVENTPNGALYGIENTNRGCNLNVTFNPGKTVFPATAVAGGPGLGITTGKADVNDSDPTAVNPGGLPIFRGCTVVGGVGVAGVPGDLAEFAAVRGIGAFPPQIAEPAVVFIDGIRLPFVTQTTQPAGTSPGSSDGVYAIGPLAGGTAPDGYLVGPHAGSALTMAEVDRIVQQAIETAKKTRASIRLPIGLRTRMVIAVGDTDGTILALYRMPDATFFSIDVAVAKARNVVYFSGAGAADLPGIPPGTAVSNRTIGFGSQPLYPPGITGPTPGPGPFFNLFLRDTAFPCSQGSQATNPNQNGVVFFPGSTPLYKNGVIVGGLGVSGDGVEQDDYVTNGGAEGFLPPPEIRADQVTLRGARLPFFKFPRNPEK